MRTFPRPSTALVTLAVVQALSAQAPAPVPADPALQALVAEALARNPDLARARALVAASKEQIPQAGALPDPTLGLGLQNDGFKGIQVGKMPTSYYQIMATQPLPWPGKRGARTDVAALGVRVQDAALERARLTLVADLERAYFGLALVREQLGLLDRQADLLQQAEGSARARYQVGQGAQADLLRAQLAQTRLQQARLGLQAQADTLLATVNRLRVRPSDTPLDTPTPLEAMPLPEGGTEQTWMDRAEAGSPDLVSAQRSLEQADRSLDLARLDRRPDFAVSAGLMPRGGLDPMWQVNVSIGLPVFSGRKQQRAVAEQEYRRQAQDRQVQTVRLLLRQRTRERLAELTSAEATLRIYKEGLLVQSEASFQAALAQYEAGKVPFLAVLEALNGWVADQSGYLQTLAQAQAQGIALREYALGATPGIGSGTLGSPSLGMSGGAPAMPSAQPGAATGGAPEGAAASTSSSMSSM